MSNVAKLKKQAAEFELKKQFDKALAIYVKLLESFDQYPDELEVALFNRVGDLMLRQGNVADAVDYYEQAVDRYADTGFFNNAIALCNKILRHSPGRASVYYKLGKISAQKGFKTDAKVNFLEYADRMQQAGKVDESFRALKEFADLCPDQDEIRLMLADQLTKADRKPEAIEQLQTLYERYDSAGQTTEARATAERMRAIDPTVEPRSGGSSQKASGPELVFLDLNAPSTSPHGVTPVRPASVPTPSSFTPSRAGTPAADRPAVRASTPSTTHAMGTPSSPAEAPAADSRDATLRLDGLIEFGDTSTPLQGVERIGDDDFQIERASTDSLLDIEPTNLSGDDRPSRVDGAGDLLDLEPTSLDPSPGMPIHRSSAPTHRADVEAGASGDEITLPEARETPVRASASIDFDLSTLTPSPATPAGSSTPASASPAVQREATPPLSQTPATPHAALDGLPMMDLDVPTPREPRVSRSFEELSDSGELDMLEIMDDAPANAPRATPASGPESDELDDISIIDEPVTVPTPSVARRSTLVAEHSVEMLRATVNLDPENWALRRQLAEAMLDAGDRASGIRELETAMAGAERAGDLDLASGLAEEVARLEPESVRHHQKRVEYAFRTNDRGRLIEAYLSLADSLLGADQADKARAVYQRVIDLAPDEMRARAALDAFTAPEPQAAAEPPATSAARRGTTSATRPAAEQAAPSADGGESFVNLGDWLRDAEGPKDTRMVVAEQEPTGDEDADFADMLRKFKQGVAANVDAEDYQSHYDLAIAFKEMGLLDEAIAEFQKALGSPANRLPTYEALGQCFLDKGQPKLAASILTRALNEHATEEQMVGVLYLLGLAAESQGKTDDALGYFNRVFILDIQFRDVADRLAELERPSR